MATFIVLPAQHLERVLRRRGIFARGRPPQPQVYCVYVCTTRLAPRRQLTVAENCVGIASPRLSLHEYPRTLLEHRPLLPPLLTRHR